MFGISGEWDHSAVHYSAKHSPAWVPVLGRLFPMVGKKGTSMKKRAIVLAACLLAGWCANAATEPSIKKYNPGHYIAVKADETELDGIEGLNSDAVQGLNKRYAWRSVESEKDQYDFSEIERDLEFLTSKHVRWNCL